MKELTHEDWQKNPTPRMMWVWDDDACNKVKRKVIYVGEQDMTYPVITLTKNESVDSRYKHCAEIAKTRRMTNKELSRWLRENPTREYKYRTAEDKDSFVYWYHSYIEREASEEVMEEVLIRENDGEWQEPLIEVEE